MGPDPNDPDVEALDVEDSFKEAIKAYSALPKHLRWLGDHGNPQEIGGRSTDVSMIAWEEWEAKGEQLVLEEFENWSRHTMVGPVAPPPDPELNFPCDVCGAKPGKGCADDCEYQKLKKQLSL